MTKPEDYLDSDELNLKQEKDDGGIPAVTGYETYYMPLEEIDAKYGPPLSRRLPKKEFLALRKKGWSLTAIAEKYGESIKAVQYLVQKYQYNSDKGADEYMASAIKKAREKLPEEKLGILLATGASVTQISKDNELPPWVIYELKKRYWGKGNYGFDADKYMRLAAEQANKDKVAEQDNRGTAEPLETVNSDNVETKNTSGELEDQERMNGVNQTEQTEVHNVNSVNVLHDENDAKGNKPGGVSFDEIMNTLGPVPDQNKELINAGTESEEAVGDELTQEQPGNVEINPDSVTWLKPYRPDNTDMALRICRAKTSTRVTLSVAAVRALRPAKFVKVGVSQHGLLAIAPALNGRDGYKLAETGQVGGNALIRFLDKHGFVGSKYKLEENAAGWLVAVADTENGGGEPGGGSA